MENGSGSVVVNERVRIHTGISGTSPCPTCDGDTPGDGVRGGTCSDGQSAGLACEAQASDPTFPWPGGGFYSIDCLPTSGSNIMGQGLPVAHTETTGTSTLASNLPCPGNPALQCPCAVCSGNSSIPCASDAVCAAASAGTCTGGGSNPPLPDNCDAAGCTVDADGEGECTTPDYDVYCDGVVEEDGGLVLSCFDDNDCLIYGPEAGACTATENTKCFGATISATGIADPEEPRTVATTCIPASAHSAANSILGLPGPGRVRTDWFVTFVE